MSQLHDVLIPGDHGLNGIDGLSPKEASARIGEVIDGARAAAEAGGASDRRTCDTEAHALMIDDGGHFREWRGMVAHRPSARARRRTRWYDPMARRCLSPCDGYPSGTLVLSTANPPDAIVPDGRRRRHLAAAARARSPEERLLAMEELLARSRVVLEANPAGRAHFLRRNFRARAVTVCPDHVRHGA